MEGSSWFTVNYGFASNVLKNVFNSYQKAYAKCKEHLKYTLDNFTIEHMKNKLQDYLENTEKFITLKNTANPVRNTLNLPKITLPKLKK